jgi:CRP-like cAMP-binding protein
MSDPSEQMLRVLSEMRDLLRLIAEPAIAQRDKKFRAALRSIAGSATGKKAKAILLMDGTTNQAGIVNKCGIDRSDLSALVKKMKGEGLLKEDSKEPDLAISIPFDFFEQGET